jgi:hydroxymethylpyrimidine pyrophosphatase-like HAD family hydrolase
MKLSAIALDYDGTIALHDVMDPGVREAIHEARAQGIRVALVTGRRLDELRRIAGDLTCFDVVVGENGAVLHFPASGREATLTHAPPQAFLDALTARAIHFAAGEAIVESDAANAPAMLAVIRELELQLSLIFNQDRVMVLPPTIAKSTGLREALRALRVSPHNALGIGNAENDHDLLDACEVAVAVAWGSPALRRMADEIVPGSDPSAVGPYLRGVARQGWLSAAQMGRPTIDLGHTTDGTPLSLPHRGRTLVITGEPGSGKSWLAGMLCEQFILQGYSLCILDSDGHYAALDTLPGVVVLEGGTHCVGEGELARALQHPDLSVVLDLSRMTRSGQAEYTTSLLPWLTGTRRHTGIPHRIVLDDAPRLLAGGRHRELIDPAFGGYILVAERAATIDLAIRAPGAAILLETDPQHPNGAIQRSDRGEAGGQRFTMLPRLTAPVRTERRT